MDTAGRQPDPSPPRSTSIPLAVLAGALGTLAVVLGVLVVQRLGDDDGDEAALAKPASATSVVEVTVPEGDGPADGLDPGDKPEGGGETGGGGGGGGGTTTSTSSTTSSSTTSTTASTTPTTLNFSLPPVYGSTALTSGFVPDPFAVGITGGGPANVSYLGGGCTGFTTSAPSFSVNYTSGAFPTLRFYFIGSGDTTMIINTPSGSYVCVDDSFGTLNPTIDFNAPSNGRYDVWIATFAEGASVAGTLRVTENTGNHP